MYVLGRNDGRIDRDRIDRDRIDRPTARLGRFRARDGSLGEAVGFDLDAPHVGLVVGKRGSGKSYTLGVLAEALADANGVTPIVVDPMGVFGGLVGDSTEGPSRRVTDPKVPADAIPPNAWPDLFGVEPTSPTGSLLWRVADRRSTLEGMLAAVDGGPDGADGTDGGADGSNGADTADGTDGGSNGNTNDESSDEATLEARPETRRAVRNHLELADSWGVFDPDGLSPACLLSAGATVVDLSRSPRAVISAVVRAVAIGLYEACLEARPDRLPWLLVDEAHVAFDGVAESALRTLSTRGRTPGVSLVAATQRPGALPAVAVSQADVIVAHELTAEADVDALSAAAPTYLDGRVRHRLPRRTGAALVVDDATEGAHAVHVRERHTPHGGESPRASDLLESVDAREQSDVTPSERAGTTEATVTGESHAYRNR